jgi:DnaJ-class molecular chaperone
MTQATYIYRTTQQQKCFTCKGEGHIYDRQCSQCNGSGKIPFTFESDITELIRSIQADPTKITLLKNIQHK